MEILILLTILLIAIDLGGYFFQEATVCTIGLKQIATAVSVKSNHQNNLILWAVKLVLKGFYLLNTVTLNSTQKATQTALIQPQNLKFEG